MSTSLNMGNNNITNAATTTTTTLNATDVNSTNVTATNNVTGTNVNAGRRAPKETYTGGWFRTTGDTGWYSEKHGGGIYMTDNSRVRVYNDKNFSTGGQIKGEQ